jgi:hypothetical protein
MFNVLIVAVMAALVAFYSARAPELDRLISHTQSRNLAGDMAVYRQAVVQYFSIPGNGGSSVAPDVLKDANLLPTWSPLAESGDGGIWANHRMADGTIFVYAASATPVEMMADLLALSKNSMQVGQYDDDCACFKPFIPGPVNIGLPLNIITNGSPVWIAHSN